MMSVKLQDLKKGQKVSVTGNEIFKMMGYEKVTGKVFLVNLQRNSFSIQCDQTGAIELVDMGDGEVELG